MMRIRRGFGLIVNNGKRSFISGLIVGVALVIVLLFLCLPYWYAASEERNIVAMKQKSELNCETMQLHCLVRDEDAEQISKYAAGYNSLEAKDNRGRTALFWAAAKNKPRFVKLLLSLNANPDTKDENDRSLFYQMIAWGKYDIATELLKAGANIDAFNGKNYPETSLHSCVMDNNVECVRFLLEKGASPYLEDAFGYTVFERIRVHNHIDSEVGELLKNKQQ